MRNRVVFIVFETKGEWRLDSTIVRCYVNGDKTFLEYVLLPENAVNTNKKTGELTLVLPAMCTGSDNLNRIEDLSAAPNPLSLVVELSDNESRRLFTYLKRCHFENWELESKEALKLWKSDPRRPYSTGGRSWTLHYWGEDITVNLSGETNSEPKRLDSFLRYLMQYNPFKTAKKQCL